MTRRTGRRRVAIVAFVIGAHVLSVPIGPVQRIEPLMPCAQRCTRGCVESVFGSDVYCVVLLDADRFPAVLRSRLDIRDPGGRCLCGAIRSKPIDCSPASTSTLSLYHPRVRYPDHDNVCGPVVGEHAHRILISQPMLVTEQYSTSAAALERPMVIGLHSIATVSMHFLRVDMF